MSCKGVPQPTIIWTRSGSSKELAYGEQFLIVNTKGSDDGTYLCIARNDVGQQDSIDVTLNVQSKYAVKVYTLLCKSKHREHFDMILTGELCTDQS